MSPVTVFRQADRVAARVIDGVAYVVVVDRQKLIQLNPVGSFIWSTLSTPATIDGITGRVVARFNVEQAEARRDTERFLSLLLERGVIEASEGSVS